VVLCMGAGSIGAVPGKVVELGTPPAPSSTTSERTARKGRAA